LSLLEAFLGLGSLVRQFSLGAGARSVNSAPGWEIESTESPPPPAIAAIACANERRRRGEGCPVLVAEARASLVLTARSFFSSRLQVNQYRSIRAILAQESP